MDESTIPVVRVVGFTEFRAQVNGAGTRLRLRYIDEPGRVGDVVIDWSDGTSVWVEEARDA